MMKAVVVDSATEGTNASAANPPSKPTAAVSQNIALTEVPVAASTMTVSSTTPNQLTYATVSAPTPKTPMATSATSNILSPTTVSQRPTTSDVSTRTSSPNSEGNRNREGMINDDITLFEAWFELMTKDKEEKNKVTVEELVDKVSTSGLFAFNSNDSNFMRKTEEKSAKEDLLDLIEEDLSLTVLEFITIDQFFEVIVRFPRYLHRLRGAGGHSSTPPKVWDKPSPKESPGPGPVAVADDSGDCSDDELSAEDEVGKSEKKLKRRKSRRNTILVRIQDLFTTSNQKSFQETNKMKRNPKQLNKQSSSFYEKCVSVRQAIFGKTKTSSVKVFTEDEVDSMMSDLQ